MQYFDEIINLLSEIRDSQSQIMEKAAHIIADAILADHLIYVFGATHAGILAQELFYRAGGLVPVNPILPPGLVTNIRPSTLTSRLERLPGFGTQIVAESAMEAGDVLIVHSVSGRNAAAVEVAQGAKERGVYVIALTSITYSKSVKPRKPGAPRLFEVGDLVLDNHAPIGDAIIEIPGMEQKVGPTSTVTGAAILNAIIVEATRILMLHDGNPPVFMSANLDGGDAYNKKWLEHYKGRLTYM
jgi:uncharacterized phosphosugar-binding protein